MARGATAVPLLWCCTWTEMREFAGGRKKQKERGLLSIKCWYPERQLRFITINRLDGNWGFVISQCSGSVVQSVDGPAVLLTASHQRRTFFPPQPPSSPQHLVPVRVLQQDNNNKKKTFHCPIQELFKTQINRKTIS